MHVCRQRSHRIVFHALRHNGNDTAAAPGLQELHKHWAGYWVDSLSPGCMGSPRAPIAGSAVQHIAHFWGVRAPRGDTWEGQCMSLRWCYAEIMCCCNYDPV